MRKCSDAPFGDIPIEAKAKVRASEHNVDKQELLSGQFLIFQLDLRRYNNC